MQARRALVTYILNPNAVFRYTERIALNSSFYLKNLFYHRCFILPLHYPRGARGFRYTRYFQYFFVCTCMHIWLYPIHTLYLYPIHTHTHHLHTSVYSNVQVHICLYIHIQSSHTHLISSHMQIHKCISVHRS